MDNNKGKIFATHRQYWASDEFLYDFFGKKWKNANNGRFAKSIQNKLLALPVLEEFDILAYGSLMNDLSAQKTLSTFETELGTLDKYERVFNMGSIRTGSYLNVRKVDDDTKSIEVIVRKIPFHDMPEFITREGNYNVEQVVYFNNDIGRNKKGIIVIGKPIMEDDFLKPQLNYVHLCMDGIKMNADMYFMDNFLENTYCFSDELSREVTLKKWLKNVNLLTYLKTYNYSSR